MYQPLRKQEQQRYKQLTVEKLRELLDVYIFEKDLGLGNNIEVIQALEKELQDRSNAR